LAVGDLGGPESKATSVGHATEKVEISLPHEEVSFFGRVPQQLAADLAVLEAGAVHVHVLLPGAQIGYLLSGGIDHKVIDGITERQREDDWTIDAGSARMNVRAGFIARQTGKQQRDLRTQLII